MLPDEEPQLRAAFSELHRRERADAPPFEGMRSQAMNAASSRQSASHGAARRWVLWGAPAIGCAAAALFWMSGRLTAPAPVSLPAKEPQLASTEHVEQLLNSIESQIETGESGAPAVYATDALLTQIDTNLTP